MIFQVTLEGLGFRYLEAPSESKASENAKWIWPNNRVLAARLSMAQSEEWWRERGHAGEIGAER